MRMFRGLFQQLTCRPSRSRCFSPHRGSNLTWRPSRSKCFFSSFESHFCVLFKAICGLFTYSPSYIALFQGLQLFYTQKHSAAQNIWSSVWLNRIIWTYGIGFWHILLIRLHALCVGVTSTPWLTVLKVRALHIDLTYLIEPVMQGHLYITLLHRARDPWPRIRLHVLAILNIKVRVFWNVTPCSPADSGLIS
jgi:hypothetical protein